ncbi:uncharacterized protein LOC106071692 [Biomphalaria glabrata]|uniref:Uncharacterized protein LOC106071692 n=1 Tax=Biomphalaria glabrata TaxID=6526 RepID=A0A9U8EH06_BIOGL|nr:uncharacterized protein LOC106071692 [Biomphalaria glabrata]
MDLTYSSLLMSLCLVYAMAGTVQTEMSTNKTLLNLENSTVDTSIVVDSIILSNSTVTSNSTELSNSIITSNSTELFNSNATSNSIMTLNGNATSNSTLTLNSTVTESTQMPNNVETLSPEIIKLKDYAHSLIANNFTSNDQCKSKVSSLVDVQASVEKACEQLKMAKGETWKVLECNENDYDLLNNGVCIHDILSTLSPETIKLKNIALSLIKNNFTSGINCTTILPKILDTQTTVDGACFMLKAAEGSIWESQGCNKEDYKLIKHEMCNDFLGTTISSLKTTQSPEEIKRHRAIVMCVIDNELSSQECTSTARGQSKGEEDPEKGCEKLKSFASTLSLFHCTDEDYRKLYSVICDKQNYSCSPITSLLKKLTNSCMLTMSAATSELKGDNACRYVESSKRGLLESSTCTDGDYAMIHRLICSADHSLIEAVAEAERVETAELTITTKLTDSCRNVIWPEYKLSNMSQMCQKVNRTGMSLVRQNICTREDFDLLKSTLCIVHREYSPEETKLRDEIHKLILTLSATCKTTMLDQEKQMQETTVQEACTKLTASREALKSSDICNEEELTKINKLICNGACTLISSWVIALSFSFTFSKLFFSL